ncbi:MAG: hypothetical protein AAGI52_10295 [Bacteroidota bacterium]
MLLAVEVATGRTQPRTDVGVWAAAVVFALAASAGGAMLVALPWTEWPLILALLPLTAICVARCLVLVRERIPGWQGVALAIVLLASGLIAGVRAVPIPLTRAQIQSAIPGGPVPSAHPNAGRLVRTAA